MPSALYLDTEKGSSQPTQLPRSQTRSSLSLSRVAILAGATALATWLLWKNPRIHSSCSQGANVIDVEAVQQCSINSLKADLSFLDNAKPIEAGEFLERRDRLAKTLAGNGVDAFVLEPGYTFQ